MTCGIYAVVNTISGKQYVGSALNIEQRGYKHFTALNAGRHPSERLTAAFAKHGRAAFKQVVLEVVDDPKRLLEREDYWIDLLRPNYNARLVANSNLGLKHAPETIRKMASSLKVTSSTPEARERLRRTSADAWAVPGAREARIAKLQATWTPEKRAAWSVQMQAADTKAVEAAAIRWAMPGASERQSELLRAAHARRGPANDEAAVRAAVEATPGWSVVSMTGTRMKDFVTVRCAAHDAEQVHTVRAVVHTKQGCRLCGWQRSSDKQKGRPK